MKVKCPKPINRILLMRARSFAGPFFQRTDKKTCMHAPQGKRLSSGKTVP